MEKPHSAKTNNKLTPKGKGIFDKTISSINTEWKEFKEILKKNWGGLIWWIQEWITK